MLTTRLNRSAVIASRFALVAGLAVLVGACKGGDDEATTPLSTAGYGGACLDSEPGTSNLLQNAGFEEGAEPWVSLTEDSGYQVTTDRAHAGEHSALLRMRDPAQASDAKVYYLVQQIKPEEMPDVICGYYRVENWMKGSRHQYLQAVAIAFKPTNLPGEGEGGFSNYQIRYLLAGADSPPFNINNAKFVFVKRDGPTTGEWVPFELHVRDDFEELWGTVPQDFEFLRLLFEVRWDNKVSGGSAAEADAYYDDLYAGPS